MTERSLEEISVDVLKCALSWEPKAKILGNVSAEEIVRLAYHHIDWSKVWSTSLDDSERWRSDSEEIEQWRSRRVEAMKALMNEPQPKE